VEDIDLGELARRFGPLADDMQALTEPLPRDSGIPAARLAALTGDTAHLVGFLLRNTHEGRPDIARHNLRILHDLAGQLMAATRAAIADCDARVPMLHGHCLAKVQLDDAQREWLMFRPYGGNEVPAVLSCELEADHGGPHAANAQMGNEIEWWAHWTLLASEITTHRHCDATQASTDRLNPLDICMLYAGHPGRHSFVIGE
jgi:hypothetical protein